MIQSFKHSGNIGDIIYSLPTCISIIKENKLQQFNYYLNINKETKYLQEHPLGNVLLNEEYAKFLLPLLQVQPYIKETKIHTDEVIQFDLDNFRKLPMDFTKGLIVKWTYNLFNGLKVYPLDKPWLFVGKNYEYKDKIIVCRTKRLNSKNINYSFMNSYANNIIFVGIEDEYTIFKEQCPDVKEFVKFDNSLKLAEAINGCKFVVANQTMLFSIAEALKTPRLVEVSPIAPNVIPIGGAGYDAQFQQPFETYFNKLNNECNI